MDESRKPILKDIIAARFKNPKFVYDGKRMRVLTERRAVDYSSSIVYYRQFPNSVHKNILNLKFTGDCKESLTTNFAHLSINKLKCPINVVRFVPNGRRLITGTATGEFTLWNGFSFNFETILQAHESPIRTMCWSYDGSFLISADNLGILKYWHPSMNNIFEIQGHEEAIRDLSLSPNDSKFCTGSDDCKLKIWDSKEGECESTLSGHGWDIKCVQWHRNKSLIASGSKDNLVKLWDPREAKELTTIYNHKNSVNALKWHNDFLLTGGKDQNVKMLDIRNMRSFTYQNKKEITAIAVSPLLNTFVTAADVYLYFWEYFNPNPISVVKAHEGTIWSIHYHPMGHVLASGSIDHSTRFWIRDRSNSNYNSNKEVVEKHQKVHEIPGLDNFS